MNRLREEHPIFGVIWLPFQTPPQGWSPLFPATQAKAGFSLGYVFLALRAVRLALRAVRRGLGLHVWSQSSSLIGISTGC